MKALPRLNGYLSSSFLLIGMLVGLAQQDTLQLEEVRLMASPIPQPLMQTPGGIAQIHSNQLQQNAGLTLTQSANNVPGLFLQQGAMNTQRLVLRGMGARSSYGTNRLKLYLNHIPLSAPDGESNPEEIDVDWLQQITIFKGSFSTEFGSAMGGALVFEVPPKTPNHVRLIGRVGAFGYKKQSAMLSLEENKFSLFAGFSHSTQEGFRQNSTYLRNSLLLMPQWNLGNHQLQATVLYNRQKAFIPSSLSFDDWQNAPETAPANWRGAAGYEAYEKVTAGLTHTFENNAWLLKTSIFLQMRDAFEPRPFDILDENQQGIGFRTHLNKNFSMLNKNSTWSLGAEFMQDRLLRKGYENLYQQYPGGSLPGLTLFNTTNRRSNGHLFALLNTEWIPQKLWFNTGVSLSNAQYAQAAVQLEDKRLDLGWVASPKIGVSWQTHPQSYLYANVSAGYSNPTSEETLDEQSQLNDQIRPEQGLQWELGHKINFWKNRLSSHLSIYHMQVRNLIVAERIGEDQYIGMNAGKTRHIGLEYALRGQIPVQSDWLLSPMMAITMQQHKFLDFVDRTNDYSGNQIPGIPTFTAANTLAVTWRSQITATLNHQYTSGYFVSDANQMQTLPYNLLHASLQYQPVWSQKWGMQWQLHIHNLLNTNYMASIVPNMQSFGPAAPRYFYPGTPRQWVLSVIIDAF